MVDLLSVSEAVLVGYPHFPCEGDGGWDGSSAWALALDSAPHIHTHMHACIEGASPFKDIIGIPLACRCWLLVLLLVRLARHLSCSLLPAPCSLLPASCFLRPALCSSRFPVCLSHMHITPS
jgi:hypothetical protein